MRFVLEFFILVGSISLIGAIIRMLYSLWIKRRDKKNQQEEVMWKELRDALSSNSRYRLEDLLILHNNNLPKEIKPVIQSRIDDLIIKESDEKLERNINK